MAQIIEHTGTVERVEGGVVTVKIVARSACGACTARAACGMGESQEKLLEIPTADAASYSAGDEVTVGVYRNAAGMAVALGYGGALAVMIAALVLCTTVFGTSEEAAVAWTLGAVAAYYVCLWALRNRIERKIHFTITKR